MDCLRRCYRTIFLVIVSASVFLPTVLFADLPYSFDHSRFTSVLQRYVSKGLVDYPSLKRDRQDLDLYVSSLGKLTEGEYAKMPHEEKMAFWINAYNAITLQVIIDKYPIRRLGIRGWRFPENSIRQIPRVWTRKKANILGQKRSLDEIEHKILRKEFQDPRIHMALVCAAMGCAPLRDEAYVGAKLDSQLKDQSRQFLSNPKKFTVDQERQVVYLSPIFKWFEKDFDMGVIGFVANYSNDESARFLTQERYDIEYLNYDWSLNDISGEALNA